MKILLTGDKGYLGGEFVKRYGNDYQIKGYDIKEGQDLLDYQGLKEPTPKGVGF